MRLLAGLLLLNAAFSAEAVFVRADSTTPRTKAKYGFYGFAVPGQKFLPPKYATIQVKGCRAAVDPVGYLWMCPESFSASIKVSDTASHQMTVQVLEARTVEVRDLATDKVLDTRKAAAGSWLVWRISGSVRIVANGPVVTIGGVFFDK